MKHWLLSIALLLLNVAAFAQDMATVTGNILSESREPLENAYVQYKDASTSTFSVTDSNGYFKIKVPAGKRISISITYLGSERVVQVPALESGTTIYRKIFIDVQANLPPVTVTEQVGRHRSIVRVDPKDLKDFPSRGSFEILMKSIILGGGGNNELSSAYNVRGGNFDENLVYVNDIEVYRPFLVRSGQQEGLSFVNVDMVDNVIFSSGGFQSKYGDKMSSVMDVTYKEPDTLSANLEASFLGGQVSLEDKIGNRFTYVVGLRYRTNQYLLGSLDVQGNYKPNFFDFQSFLKYRVTSTFSINLLTNISRNRFLLVPESQETDFGTVQNALRLYVAFGGQELMSYQTFMNGLSFVYKPNPFNEIKFISSVYSTAEREHFTVEGAYRLDLLDNNLGSESFGEAKYTLGIGYFINHARNDLNALVFSEKIMGRHRSADRKSVYEWGVKFQGEQIEDVIREWDYNDSAGHNVSNPGYNPNEILLANVLRTKINLNSFRMMGYIQHTVDLNEASGLKLNYGLRSNYWTLNNQNVVSPRIQIAWQPNKKFNDILKDSMLSSKTLRDSFYDPIKRRALLKDDWLIRASAGYYYQPPFYRELRNSMGEINKNLKAQRSMHFVVGGDLDFYAWNRPFKFIVEGYYKSFDQLIPYYIDDVRIRYQALNTSKGYATGIDARVNGEFIQGLESYVNLSWLTTKENISYIDSEGVPRESGYIRRPTDQRFNASILFQDQLKSDSTFRLQLQLVLGTNLPYYFDGDRRYVESLKIPAYRRVDIGFSKILFDRYTTRKAIKYSYIERIWLSVEVFNLLQFNNTISYIWVKDINNNVYGVPNRLTGRRLNLRIRAEF